MEKLKSILEDIDSSKQEIDNKKSEEQKSWLEVIQETAWNYNSLEEVVKELETQDGDEGKEVIDMGRKIYEETKLIVDKVKNLDSETKYKELIEAKNSLVKAKVSRVYLNIFRESYWKMNPKLRELLFIIFFSFQDPLK